MLKLLVFVAILAFAIADVSLLRSLQTPTRFNPTYNNPYIKILRQDQRISPEGSYQWSYDTENGISAEEQGHVEQETLKASGSYRYTSPEGVPVSISYIADENGYQPQGDILPTPPPTPIAILRSLEYIRTHPARQQTYQPYKFV